MNRTISYCLFSKHAKWDLRPLYWQCLPAVVRLHHLIYPSWKLVIHHDSSINLGISKALRNYAKLGLLELRYVEENTACYRSSLWRMMPIWDADNEYTLCRDLDMIPTPRERKATDTFLRSGAACHCMNDHKEHNVPLMAGMIGFKNKSFIERTGYVSWKNFISHADESKLKETSGGYDQTFLTTHVYSKMKPSICEHRSSGYYTSLGFTSSYRSFDTSALEPFSKEQTDALNSLTPFLGCPDFDIKRAIEVSSSLLPTEIAEKFKEAEK